MKAVILVGGEGTRLRPLTYDIPKPMVPIVNKPYMEHQIDYLMRHGFNELIFALGYKSEAFESYFGDGSRWGARFHHVVEDEPLGTAGAVKNVEALLDDTFLVFNGDVLSGIDLTALVQLHRARVAVATLALTPVEDPSSYGVVVMNDEGRVSAFIEKPPREQAPSNAINAGVYVLEPSVVAAMPPGRRFMFETNVFPDLLASGQPVYASVSDAYWLDIGSPQRYLQANADVLEGRAQVPLPALENHRSLQDGSRIEEGAHLDGQVWLGAGAVIESGARIQGPLWVGAEARVARGAEIHGPVVLGRGCHIAGDAVIKHSTIWDGSRIERGARLQRALVGRNSRVGEHAVIEEEAVLGTGQTLQPNSRLEAGARQPV